MRVHGRVRGPHGRGRTDLASAVLCGVPALERISGARGRGQATVLATISDSPGRFIGLAAVAVECKRVRVDGPVRVHGRVRGPHGRGRGDLRAVVPGGVPALERISGARGRGQAAVLATISDSPGGLG